MVLESFTSEMEIDSKDSSYMENVRDRVYKSGPMVTNTKDGL